MADFTDNIREAVALNNYLITTHAISRMASRHVLEEDLLRVILEGEVIEIKPEARPFPKCLFMMPIEPNEPLYAVCGYGQGRAS